MTRGPKNIQALSLLAVILIAMVVLGHSGGTTPSSIAVCTAEDWSNSSTTCATPDQLSRTDLTHSYLVLHMHDNAQSEAMVRVYDEGTDGQGGGDSLAQNNLALDQGSGDWGWKYKDVLAPDSFLGIGSDWKRGHIYQVQVVNGTASNPGAIIGETRFTYSG